MGQQSLIGAVTMKCFVVLALALAAASAIHIPKKYEHYKPGYMRIPGWEDIASGKRKLNKKSLLKCSHPDPTPLSKPHVESPDPWLRNMKELLVELKPHPISSHGKLDYSSTDTSAVAASFLRNTSRLLLTVLMVCSTTKLSLEPTKLEIPTTKSLMLTAQLSTLIGTAITLPMIWLSSSLTPQLTLALNPM